jgi:hypothetical protein
LAIVANSLDCKARIEAATVEAVRDFETQQAIAKQKATRLQKGQLTVIIVECKSKHGIEESVDINAATIRQRIKRNTVSSLKGTKSPMADIEPYLVSLILQLANMRIPITTAQGLQLCNSIIKGTKFQRTICEFQKNNLRSVTNELGPGYWQGFLKRNKHLIKTKRAVKFDTKRAEWCTYQNLE